MNQGKQYSLWKLISPESGSQKILIPQIQRDYVQFREGRVAINRKLFVSALVKALVENEAINLNFVYGNISLTSDKNSTELFEAFNPIDGQQRLTTLYLLHYYVFNEADATYYKDALRGRLLYRTRGTTETFLDDLFKNNCDKFHGKDATSPSKVIRESGWYSSLWENDSSILSCLKVLDQFKMEFDERSEIPNGISWKDLTNRLISAEGYSCPITFMKLELDKLDKPNELYIKMNSRGKQLTPLENFKSELYGFLKEERKSDPDFLPDFQVKMDGEWLDFIWNMCNVGVDEKEKNFNSEKYSDVLYRDLLHVCFLNSIVAKGKSAPPKAALEEHSSKYYLKSYQTLLGDQDLFKEAIEEFYYTMKFLCGLKNDDAYSDIAEKVFCFYSGSQAKEIIIRLEANTTYPTRVLLYAIMRYANSDSIKKLTGSDSFVGFPAWWRIIKNLVANARVDEYDNFILAIKKIADFKNAERIDEYLNGIDDAEKFLELPSLNPSQLREEIVKQKIIKRYKKEWQDEILKAEAHSYFCGEIYFALKLSDIERVEDVNPERLKLFQNNWKAINEIFGMDNNILLHRALLTYGDYSEEFSGTRAGNDCLLNYYSSYEKNHNLDWRGMLRDEKKLAIFKLLLNDFKHSTQKFDQFAQKIIKEYLTKPHEEDCNYYLIKNEKLFQYMGSPCRCWFKNGEIRLLTTKNRASHINFMLYQLATELGLEKVSIYNGDGVRKEGSILYRDKEYFFKDNHFCQKDGKKIVTTVKEMKEILDNS